jgi:serine/threonine protein kinase
VIHRDLKPENIIFKSSDQIDIGVVDLGFATLEQDYGKLFKRCGTPGYVAPEILNDKPYNCKADVYSAGIIFYILLTGKIPFQGTSYREIVYKNMHALVDFEIPRKMKISKQTMDLLLKMLTVDPKKRISSKQALNHSCFQIMLSKSPLIMKPFFNSKNIVEQQFLTRNHARREGQKITQKRPIPNRIEDLSPSPIPSKRKKSPILIKTNLFKHGNY